MAGEEKLKPGLSRPRPFSPCLGHLQPCRNTALDTFNLAVFYFHKEFTTQFKQIKQFLESQHNLPLRSRRLSSLIIMQAHILEAYVRTSTALEQTHSKHIHTLTLLHILHNMQCIYSPAYTAQSLSRSLPPLPLRSYRLSLVSMQAHIPYPHLLHLNTLVIRLTWFLHMCTYCKPTYSHAYATIVYNQSMPNMQPSNAKYATIQCQICCTSGIVCTFGIGYEVKMALCAQMALYA